MRAWELRRTIAAFFMPNRCPFCGDIIRVREFWCAPCCEHLLMLDDPGEIPEGLDGFSAVCRYSGRARTAVLRLKEGYYRYPADAFAVLIAENAAELIQRSDVITAIPSGRKRRRELGYAQAELIAKMLSQISGKPFRRLLSAEKGKLEQKRLSREERLENAARAFRFSGREDIRGKSVLVIDDVCTTGATMSAAAGLIRNAGAAEVCGAVFARVMRK